MDKRELKYSELKISLDDLIVMLKSENSIAKEFIISTSITLEGVAYPIFKASGGSYYHYNYRTRLWKEMKREEKLTNFIQVWLEKAVRDVLIKNTTVTNFDKIQEKILIKVNHLTQFNIANRIKQSMTYLIEDDEFIEKLDVSHPDWLPIESNLMINLQTKEQRQRMITDYCTSFCPVNQSPISKLFRDTMGEIMCEKQDHIEYLQKILGYCLTGSKEAQSYFVWWGKGGNGKSLVIGLLTKVLTKVLGGPVDKRIVANMNSKASFGPEMMSLKGKRFGSFEETNTADTLNEGLLKSISGSNKIAARGLYKDQVEFELFIKLIIATNFKPSFDGCDIGTTRRIKLLPFNARFCIDPKGPNQYEIDPELETKLHQREYLNEFFSWCLEGAAMWYNDKLFNNIPKDIQDNQDQYIREQNSFLTWCNESLEAKVDGKLLRSTAWMSYSKYLEDTGLKGLSKKDFFTKMSDEIIPAVKQNCGFIFKGYQLKEDQPSDFIE